MLSKRLLIWNMNILFLFYLIVANAEETKIKGIYITQNTLENTQHITDLLSEAKASGINTFVIDYTKASSRYSKNIKLVEQANIKYVARIVVFPNGGTRDQVTSLAYWQDKYKLVDQAIALGANAVQLDYIRYNSKQPRSPNNARDIYDVIKWFRQQIPPNISLQIDVFGETSFGESSYIGQNLQLFAQTVNTISPMVYPSHYNPSQRFAKTPYLTVTLSLRALKRQFGQDLPFQLIPFIEMSNFRAKQTNSEKQQYICEQLRAVYDNNANGWYAWSAGNKYHNLFLVLKPDFPAACCRGKVRGDCQDEETQFSSSGKQLD